MTKTISPVEICKNHTGKMEGIQSISTAVTLNPFCQEQQKVKDSICSHCFAEAMMKMYDALDAKLARNTELLTTKVLDESELPDTTGQKIFRFESFGDLNNETQLINYLNIAKHNPDTRFTLWTKRYKRVHDYFATHDVPENFTLILSSMMVNVKMPLTFMKKLGKFKPGQLKSFTVYDKDYIMEHWAEMNLTCGSRFCMGCRLCYDKNEVEEISEVLKKDQPEVDRYLECHDPAKIAANRAILEEVDSLFSDLEL